MMIPFPMSKGIRIVNDTPATAPVYDSRARTEFKKLGVLVPVSNEIRTLRVTVESGPPTPCLGPISGTDLPGPPIVRG